MADFEHAHDVHPETIATTPHGAVQRCSSCGVLHLRFGNAVLRIHADDLDSLQDAVRENQRRAEAIGWTSPADRRFELQMGESGIAFAFNSSEIRELHVLLALTAGGTGVSGLTEAAPSPRRAIPAAIARRLRRHPHGRA